jgi:acyl-CoA thioesterase FadM
MSSLNAAICTTISCTLWVEWYYLKNNYLTFRSKVNVPWRSLWYATHHLMVMHPHANYYLPISKDKNVMARTRKYYLKNNYLTLRSKVKVQRRSLRYATHNLMVMHPHTKYHWPISKDKKVMVRTIFAEKKRKKKKKKRKRKKKIRLKQYVSLRSKGRHKNTWVQENVNKH